MKRPSTHSYCRQLAANPADQGNCWRHSWNWPGTPGRKIGFGFFLSWISLSQLFIRFAVGVEMVPPDNLQFSAFPIAIANNPILRQPHLWLN
jgi:hypothetical protein